MEFIALTTKLLASAIVLLLLASACCEAKGVPSPRAIRPAARHARRPNDKVFNVLQYGAKANPSRDNAIAFIKAWKATCNFPGYARLVIPAGEFFASEMVFQGPCNNPAPLVQIIGTIKAVSDLSNYAEDFWMSFEKIDGLMIAGTGTVDGQGPNVWKYNSGGGSLPVSMKVMHCTNATIKQFKSLNSMGFHLAIVESHNVEARNLHLIAPADSPNTDGIHIGRASQVRIARSVIATGDDCIGMVHGSTDITINKVVCGPGHGISIGSLGKYKNEEDVKGIVVANCTLKHTDNGLRIKTFAGSPPSQALALTFQDIIMENVTNPIIIDQKYGSKSGSPSRVKISNVKYINVRGTSNSEVGVELMCSKSVPCGVRLSNINLKYVGRKKLPFSSTCANAKISYGGKQFPPPCRSSS